MINISMDVWGTLLKASPLFKEKKIELMKEYVGDTYPSHYIENAFKEVKSHFDFIIERSGYQPTLSTLWDTLFSYFNTDLLDKAGLINEYQSLAIKYPPSLYDENTEKVIQLLSSRDILSISSNTLFIKGLTLRKILENHGVAKYFKKMYFSDEVGLSKPNKYMYEGSIIHIGDNPITDGEGARNAGCLPVIINSNNKTIKDAYNEIFCSNPI